MAGYNLPFYGHHLTLILPSPVTVVMVPSPIRRTPVILHPVIVHPVILHVEDDKAQAEALKSILERSGFVVLQASTAEDALRLFQQEPTVSLVLADHILGGKTGTQLAAQIKEVKPTVPVVMHSGQHD